jgi:hypothetical protein
MNASSRPFRQPFNADRRPGPLVLLAIRRCPLPEQRDTDPVAFNPYISTRHLTLAVFHVRR